MNVSSRVSKGACRLVRRRVKDLPESWHTPERWLHWEEATAVGRVVDWTSSVGSKRSESLVRFNTGGTTSWGASAEIIRINWIFDNFAFIAVPAEWAHTHLIHVGWTYYDGSGISEFFYSSRVDRRNEPLEDSGSCTWLQTFDQDVVFNCNWNTVDLRFRLI